jgi:hypothetical protein
MQMCCESHEPAVRIMDNIRADDAAEALKYAASLIRPKEEFGQLRAFAQEIMQAWPESGIDGDDLQEIATRHGLLTPKIMHAPCGDNCSCAEMIDPDEWESGATCYRKTPLLTGE